MGQVRPRRKRAVVGSSDDESEIANNESRHQPPRPSSQSDNKKKASNKSGAQSKHGTQSIHSFFSAAQRQQVSSQESLPSTTTQNDDIDDDDIDVSGDDRSVALSQGSMRKRKIPDGQSERPIAASQKFRKISHAAKAPTSSTGVIQHDIRPWTERFAPTTLSELAVHPRKVADVRNLLNSALSDRARPRLIILKGAAGTAKTTTVNLLAKDLGVNVIEWKSPDNTDIAGPVFASYSSQFQDFVFRSGKFNGLDLIQSDGQVPPNLPQFGKQDRSSDRKQIMLVEEFPNTFVKNSPALQIFRDTIQQFLAAPASSFCAPIPLVMVISEALLSTTTASSDSFTAHRLLGPAILNHSQTAQIEFNNIAITILTKALETIVVKEARKSGRRFTPGPGVLKRLAENGDVRSAVSSLEFLCLAGDDSEAWSSKVAFTKPKGRVEAPLTQKEQEALKLVSNRESSLGIFHAVGRVVYNKRIVPQTAVPQPPTFLPQHRRPKVPENDPQSLINEVGTDTSTFIAALQENYALSCSSSSSEDAMDSLNGCIDALSDSDMLCFDRFGFGNTAFSGSAQDNIRQDDMSFQTAVLGLLFWLPSPVNRIAGLTKPAKRGDEFRMFYPSSLKLWKQKDEIEGTLDNVSLMLHSQARRSELVLSSKDNGNNDTGANANPTNLHPATMLGSIAKKEMLLDRLPYTSQIMSHRRDIPRPLLSGIGKIVHMSGSAVMATFLGDEEVEADDLDISPRQAEWADRPDGEAFGIGKTKRPREPKSDFGGQGLHTPVEHAVEKLVLSDDDIEDD